MQSFIRCIFSEAEAHDNEHNQVNLALQVLVHHCQLWTSRLTASLSAVTSREIASLSEELHTKEQDILQARQALGSQEPTGLSGEEVWLEDIKARTEAVASHIEALASYKVPLMLSSWC